VAEGLEWEPVWVGSAAFGVSTWASDANVGRVKVEGGVFPIGPLGDIPVGIIPLSAHSGGKSGIAFAEILFVLVVVGGASEISVNVSRPSVFSYVRVPLGAESRDSIVVGDAFVASSECLAERIDTVLGWSSATGNSFVVWKTVAGVVLESLGDGFTVPG